MILNFVKVKKIEQYFDKKNWKIKRNWKKIKNSFLEIFLKNILIKEFHMKLKIHFILLFALVSSAGDKGKGSANVTTLSRFDREKQKYYLMPVIIQDSGNPPMSGTNTLTITIGDKNDNIHGPGHKDITVYNYRGRFCDTEIRTTDNVSFVMYAIWGL